MPQEWIVVVDSSPTLVVSADNATTVVERDRPVVVAGDNIGPQGPQGATGPTGPTGPAGVYVSDTAPTDTDLIWVDTTGL